MVVQAYTTQGSVETVTDSTDIKLLSEDVLTVFPVDKVLQGEALTTNPIRVFAQYQGNYYKNK